MIYLNCAATSHDRPPCVAEAVVEAMGNLGSSGRGAGDAELGAARTVAHARVSLARLLGSDSPERVVFTANATEALNIAILGCVRPGDPVVATDWDHNSVLRPLYRLERAEGVRLSFWRADRRGRLDLADLERLCVPGTRLVAVTHGSNLTGNLVDVAACAEVAHAVGALLLVDCSQTAGSVPFSMERAGADLVVFTGHKALLGPQGTGGLIVAPGVEVEPVLSGGTGIASSLPHQPDAYPEHLEAGTLNGHGIAGLGAGVDWLLERGVGAVHSHDLALVAEVANYVTVMYAGQVVEQAPTIELLMHPTHEYTRGLLGAVLSIEGGSGRLHQVPGVVPSPKDFNDGDRFAPRSSHPTVGLDVRPVLKKIPGTEHYVAELPDKDLAAAGLTSVVNTPSTPKGDA